LGAYNTDMANNRKIRISEDAYDVLKSKAANQNQTMVDTLDQLIHGTEVTTRQSIIKRLITDNGAGRKGAEITRAAIMGIVHNHFTSNNHMKDRFDDHKEWVRGYITPKSKFEDDVDNAIKTLRRNKKLLSSDNRGYYIYN